MQRRTQINIFFLWRYSPTWAYSAPLLKFLYSPTETHTL